MAWGKAGSSTLTTTGDTVSLSSMTSSNTYMFLNHIFSSGAADSDIRINGDTGSNYARRRSFNGATDATETSQSKMNTTNFNSRDYFAVTYAVGVSTEEKLLIMFGLDREGAGAANAPGREEVVGKWSNTSDSITGFSRNNLDGAGDYTADSNLAGLGSDLTPAAAVPAIENVQDNSLFVEKDIAARYWFDGTNWTMQPTFEDDFSTDKGWVSSDAQAKIDTSNGYLLLDEDGDGSAHIVYYDIGRTLDDTKWLWRFKITTNTFTMNSDPTPQIVHIRISDNTTQRDVATEDAIGFSYRTSDGNQKYIRTTYSDGATFGTTSNFSTQIATGTHYVQITRDSSTQFTVDLYSDSSYSSLVESKSVTIPSTITSLRYLKIDNYDNDGTGNGRMIFHIDDMKLYNGVTSIN